MSPSMPEDVVHHAVFRAEALQVYLKKGHTPTFLKLVDQRVFFALWFAALFSLAILGGILLIPLPKYISGNITIYRVQSNQIMFLYRTPHIYELNPGQYVEMNTNSRDPVLSGKISRIEYTSISVGEDYNHYG